MIRWPRGKLLFIAALFLLYVIAGFSFWFLANAGILAKLPPTPINLVGNDTIEELHGIDIIENLIAAQEFFKQEFLRQNGHIELYRTLSQNGTLSDDANTNSEAVSYYLLWAAQTGNKEEFDSELLFIEENMLSPIGYLMWQLTPEDIVNPLDKSGSNIASDADLRAIHALLIAEERWKDERYTRVISTLTTGLERTAITSDGFFAPYGGASGNSTWVADESWLSYSDFVAFRELANREGEPWVSVYDKMKRAILGAQLQNGLYNSELTKQRKYGNGIDANGYGINSLWIMVRAAESDDVDLRASASKSLAFYKSQFARNLEIDTLYGSNGDALSPGDAPWVYALVGRAAVALGDREFSDTMLLKLLEKQITNCSSQYYGAFPEGAPGKEQLRVGQFTTQEAILTMQAYVLSRGESVVSSEMMKLLAEKSLDSCAGEEDAVIGQRVVGTRVVEELVVENSSGNIDLSLT